MCHVRLLEWVCSVCGLLRKDLCGASLVISALVFLQRAHGAVERFQQEGLATAVATDHKVDRPKVLPPDRFERPEVLQFKVINHKSSSTMRRQSLSTSADEPDWITRNRRFIKVAFMTASA